MRRRTPVGAVAALLVAGVLLAASPAARPWAMQASPEPGREPFRFAVIGDNGTGSREQYEVGATMAAVHARSPFSLVLMLGDNLYGRQEAADFADKFERPYRALLDARVLFRATLGNHDDPGQIDYPSFGMNGQRYYTFVERGVRFISIDSLRLDTAQQAWIERVLTLSREPWKIAFFHYPLYSNASRHGSDVELRVLLEPILVRHGVNVVFSGHDHIYERVKPQKGITYFLAGSGGQLRKGDLRPAATTAAGFDQDQVFVVAAIQGDEMAFQAISRTGTVVDAGVIARVPDQLGRAATGERYEIARRIAGRVGSHGAR
jgi:3',5'-cyclic AMP phosphodiesterase CpdA